MSCGCQMLFVHQASYPTETYDSFITLSLCTQRRRNCLPLLSPFIKISFWEHCGFLGLCSVNEISSTDGEMGNILFWLKRLAICYSVLCVLQLSLLFIINSTAINKTMWSTFAGDWRWQLEQIWNLTYLLLISMWTVKQWSWCYASKALA